MPISGPGVPTEATSIDDQADQRRARPHREAVDVGLKDLLHFADDAPAGIGFQFGLGDLDGFFERLALFGVNARVQPGEFLLKQVAQLIEALDDAAPVEAAVVDQSVDVIAGGFVDVLERAPDNLILKLLLQLFTVGRTANFADREVGR